jgi:signal transduction histidine kinase
VLRRERQETARALARLLPLERQQTDRHLVTERARSDGAVATRDDFLGIVTHDLRDLLGGIVMSAGLLAKRGAAAGDDGTVQQTARIHRYAARMNRLIGDLVDVASIDAGKLAMATAPGDARLVVSEAVDAFREAAGAKGITLDVELAEAPLTAAFDHDRLLQVFANLISNAIKFTGTGGRVTIRGEGGGGTLRFGVEDTGTGIPSHMHDAIFEKFWQATTGDRRGLGLGLYISRCIVDAHGGRIWAESTEGRGSTIWFTIAAL